MIYPCAKCNYWYFLYPALALLLDQGSKLLVHAHMAMGEAGEIRLLGDFLKLHYIINPGMAFGIPVGGYYGKFVLTAIRLVVMGGLGCYMYRIIRNQRPKGLIICIGVILGGACGNVMDSIFYGVWLNNALVTAPTPWFHGQVIDMFYVDIWNGFIPESVPFMGGMYIFLWPIFNLADAYDTVHITTQPAHNYQAYSREHELAIVAAHRYAKRHTWIDDVV